ncbi:hypothetical protein B0T22DRAFT_488985 [Podospora appendiculata]|uniref:NADH-cytochrome b5 reductase 1 n=1 Tax=Podospora appendiculata TaxID=314037 RepID=A0AAE1CIB2_9PEZI|nr:hypothetical protein B0T22DRAFT_488985 [Podospora appendiculata]
MEATYSLAEVRQHNKADDIWLVLHNKVYDVSTYLEDHPGGSAILRDVAGKDATIEFEDVGHSQEATDELVHFLVGELKTEEHAEKVEVYRPTFHHVSQDAAIAVRRKQAADSNTKSATRKALQGLVGVGLTVGVGAAVFESGHLKGTGIDCIVRAVRKSFTKATGSVLPAGSSKYSGLFWWGFGIATVVEVSLSLGVSMWAWSRFDVQQDFTKRSPRRIARADRVVPVLPQPSLPKRKPNSTISTPAPASRVLEPKEFRPFKLVRKTLVSPNVYRLVFALPHANDVLGLPTGQHIALRATIDGKAVSRSYTPVSNNSDLGRIELLIKVYEKGLMTQHLAHMPVGASIDIRGPKGAMQYAPNVYARQIGMIAGGTGITPMFQLIRAICDDDADTTQLSLIYANNTEEDILLRDELDGFVERCPDKFRVHYVLGKAPEGWTGSSGFVTVDMIKKHLPAATVDGTKALLCGPPPMINAMTKNLVQLGFTAPGTVSKATDQVFLF